MNGLAEIALHYFRTFLSTHEPAIDLDFACQELEGFSALLASLSGEEQIALSHAARNALEEVNKPPDEFGYSPGILTSEDEKVFLQALASGEAFD